jgi:uncharacterized membrane protein
MSVMSLLALLVYGVVIFSAFAAAVMALRRGDRPGDLPHWIAAAAIFTGLALMRLLDGEERFRELARGMIQVAGRYEDRAILQLPLALVVLTAIIGLAWLFFRQWRRTRHGSRARLVLLSRFALLGLVPLYALRLVSLHQVDRLFYSGPVRLNWVLEGLICLAVGLTAGVYAWSKRRVPSSRRYR